MAPDNAEGPLSTPGVVSHFGKPTHQSCRLHAWQGARAFQQAAIEISHFLVDSHSLGAKLEIVRSRQEHLHGYDAFSPETWIDPNKPQGTINHQPRPK